MKKLTKISFLLLFLSIFGASVCVAQIPASNPQTLSGYHLLKKIEIGGEGGWDYLFADSKTHRLYVSHSTKVVVIDTESGNKIGEITNTNGVHGIAIADKLGRGFTSYGRDNSVTIFDLKTLKRLEDVKVGKNPDAIIYDEATKRVFAFNGGSFDATVIDAASGKVVGTIDLGGKPEFATSNGKGMIFVNIEDKSEVVAIDSRSLTAKEHWSIAPGEEPSGMAIDTKTHRLFIVCSNEKMIILNADTGKVIADLAIGEGTDAAGFDPKTKLAFSSNGAGNLTIIREDSADKFSIVESIQTQRGARTMTLDTKTGNIYLPTAEFGETPAPTKERPNPRPSIVPNSFVILVFGK
ncbi:MAG TPA: YncE family protein [Pyrinomonadaceae bacterium]|jgi:DNA-binding beta-propeller fold protein YncE